MFSYWASSSVVTNIRLRGMNIAYSIMIMGYYFDIKSWAELALPYTDNKKFVISSEELH